MKIAENTYKKYGLGFKRDWELNKHGFYTDDVLDLAQELKASAPPLFRANHIISTNVRHRLPNGAAC